MTNNKRPGTDLTSQFSGSAGGSHLFDSLRHVFDPTEENLAPVRAHAAIHGGRALAYVAKADAAKGHVASRTHTNDFAMT